MCSFMNWSINMVESVLARNRVETFSGGREGGGRGGRGEGVLCILHASNEVDSLSWLPQ